MSRASIFAILVLASACGGEPSQTTPLASGLEGSRTLGSLDANETRTLCERFVEYAETETARDDARRFHCTELALLGDAETPAACETEVDACLPTAAYESDVDCTEDHFDDACAVTVEQFEACVVAQIAQLTGASRNAIDCSLAGTDGVDAALAMDAIEGCAAAPGCNIDD
ncbi:hypothetical protein [Sandaracinus amylolyticus]|uniref:hypothetical protein n=1 Tax=Sandaracinus amylolyticus TaxID=927083 RepID=UPI001F2EC8BA|nr:hypothetical protein [Sandaracinus amylolyticus]UJR81318.1 Hypothetical protein I5071_33750 [Sandaracinus amylolyticus]